MRSEIQKQFKWLIRFIEEILDSLIRLSPGFSSLKTGEEILEILGEIHAR